MTIRQLNLCKRLLFLTSLAIPCTGALAQGDEAYLQYRQKVMKSVGANMGAIGDILKNELPHQKNIATHARAIQSASALMESAFLKKITAGKTDAKPEIWQEWDKFTAAAKKLGEESGKLAGAAESGEADAIGAAVDNVGRSCGGCHRPYRKPKAERFKR